MPEVLRCILIDDELLALTYLRSLCEEIPGIEVVKAFDDPERCLEELRTLQIDFCISDIVMPSMNGLELAEKLNGMPVIFTTAHNEFAADAFDIQAVDYLRKPVRKERLEQAIAKTKLLIQQQRVKPITLTTAKGKMLVQPGEIACISAETLDRRDKLALLRNGEELVLKNYSFDQLLALLPGELFIRVSRKDLLAKSMIKGHSAGTVFSHIKDKKGIEKTFILGENYRRTFIEQFPA